MALPRAVSAGVVSLMLTARSAVAGAISNYQVLQQALSHAGLYCSCLTTRSIESPMCLRKAGSKQECRQGCNRGATSVNALTVYGLAR